MGKIIVLSGFSGAGKDSIAKELKQRFGFAAPVSYTTRRPRDGEVSGVDYNFVPEDMFLEMEKNGAFIETTCYCGNHYGTAKAEIDQLLSNEHDIVMVLDFEGAMAVRKLYPDDAVLVFVTANPAELRRRLVERGGMTEDEIEERLGRVPKEAATAKEYGYLLDNIDLSESVDLVYSILKAERMKAEYRYGEMYRMFSAVGKNRKYHTRRNKKP